MQYIKVLYTVHYISSCAVCCACECIFCYVDAVIEFPEELYDYELDEMLLQTVFEQVQSGKSNLKWCLHGVLNMNSSRSYYLFQPRASVASIQGRLLYEGNSYFKDRARTSPNAR